MNKVLCAYIRSDQMEHHLLPSVLGKAQGWYRRQYPTAQFSEWKRFHGGYVCNIL